MRVLGIDYGTRRVGLALGDTEGKVAVPLTVLRTMNHESGIMGVVELVKREGVELVVIGQGGKGPMESKVQEFAERLRNSLRSTGLPSASQWVEVPVEIVDEHFTTAQIERTIKDYGKARKGVDKDAAAAALILQTFLDGCHE